MSAPRDARFAPRASAAASPSGLSKTAGKKISGSRFLNTSHFLKRKKEKKKRGDSTPAPQPRARYHPACLSISQGAAAMKRERSPEEKQAAIAAAMAAFEREFGTFEELATAETNMGSAGP